jgi:hypothetical protein
MRPLQLTLRGLFLILAWTVAAAPAHAQAAACHAPLQPMLIVDLYFGRSAPHGGVTERRWSAFLAQEVTPRFPDGLTVVDGTGQWRAAAHKRIVRERAKVVTIAVAAADSVHERIAAIVTAYKRRFQQKSVGVVVRDGCGAF